MSPEGDLPGGLQGLLLYPCFVLLSFLFSLPLVPSAPWTEPSASLHSSCVTRWSPYPSLLLKNGDDNGTHLLRGPEEWLIQVLVIVTVTVIIET